LIEQGLTSLPRLYGRRF